MQLFTFFHIENTSKQQKNAGFYEYGANAFEAVQKISTRTLLESCQLIKTANFIATPMKKHLAFHYLLIGDTSQVLFFFLTITNE